MENWVYISLLEPRCFNQGPQISDILLPDLFVLLAKFFFFFLFDCPTILYSSVLKQE